MNLIIGGPSYRLEVDARHAQSVALLAMRATMPRTVAKKSFGGKMRSIVTPSDTRIHAFHYEHGNPVEVARSVLFESDLTGDESVTHLLWLDSDTEIPIDQIDPILAALHKAAPIVLVPCQQREGGVSNIWQDRDTKLTRVPLDGSVKECWAGGFGCVGFDLRWYREHWPASQGPHFRSTWDPEHSTAAGRTPAAGYVSEDYWHCREIIARGGQVQYVGAYVAHHARGGA